jgi:predicted ATPase/DNA-binding winged helix-turn-helix (wHTH) protein
MLIHETSTARSHALTLNRDKILFEEFCLIPATRTLTRHGSPVSLRARALDILIALIERAGQTVSQAELYAIVWEKRIVEESNLRVNMAALRKALGDDRQPRRFILSVPGRGYTFIGRVERIPSDETVAASAEPAIANDENRVSTPLVAPIGRDGTISEIAAQLRRKRFVTITGAGGIGKTTVALAVAHELAGAFRDGVRLIDLGSLASPALVAPYLASLLRLPAPDKQPLQYVIAHLRGRNMLIVFDNCEGVIDVVSEIAEAIIHGAHDVNILATSREPLRAAGEWVWRLDPLAVPPVTAQLTAVQALGFPAVQLFAERWLASDLSYKLTDVDAPIMAEICRRLDGLPLAIELAATRVPLFGLRGLADRLKDRFAVLTKGRRTALPRHQSLGAMIDWSFATLSLDESAVWPRLAVFPGTFTLEAAAAVATDQSTEKLDIVNILHSLVQKSLVAVDSQAGDIRYRLLESLRLYALTKLIGINATERTRARHARYWYERSAGRSNDWEETPTSEWLRDHSGEIANLRAALEWAFAPGGDAILGIKLTASSAPLWFKMLLQCELRQHLEHAIQLAAGLPEVEEGVVVQLRLALGNSIYHERGSAREVSDALDEALAIAERRNDIPSQLQAIWTCWGQACFQRDDAAMKRSLERIQTIIAKSPEQPIAPLYYARMAALSYHVWGDQQTALHHAQMAHQYGATVQHNRQSGELVHEQEAAASHTYARTLWLSGYPDQASAVMRDAFAAGWPFAIDFFLSFTAVSFWTGDFPSAARYLSTLLNVQGDMKLSERPQTVDGSRYDTVVRLYRRVLDFLSGTEHSDRNTRDSIIHDPALTSLAADHLSTFDWRLLCPQSLQPVMHGRTDWCTAEVLRAQGETLLEIGEPDADAAAEELFVRSMDISRRQGARSWELRSAMSLARLWHVGAQTARARDLLAEVYGRFPEGFGTRDLIQAQALLDQLLTAAASRSI